MDPIQYNEDSVSRIDQSMSLDNLDRSSITSIGQDSLIPSSPSIEPISLQADKIQVPPTILPSTGADVKAEKPTTQSAPVLPSAPGIPPSNAIAPTLSIEARLAQPASDLGDLNKGFRFASAPYLHCMREEPFSRNKSPRKSRFTEHLPSVSLAETDMENIPQPLSISHAAVLECAMNTPPDMGNKGDEVQPIVEPTNMSSVLGGSISIKKENTSSESAFQPVIMFPDMQIDLTNASEPVSRISTPQSQEDAQQLPQEKPTENTQKRVDDSRVGRSSGRARESSPRPEHDGDAMDSFVGQPRRSRSAERVHITKPHGGTFQRQRRMSYDLSSRRWGPEFSTSSRERGLPARELDIVHEIFSGKLRREQQLEEQLSMMQAAILDIEDKLSTIAEKDRDRTRLRDRCQRFEDALLEHRDKERGHLEEIGNLQRRVESHNHEIQTLRTEMQTRLDRAALINTALNGQLEKARSDLAGERALVLSLEHRLQDMMGEFKALQTAINNQQGTAASQFQEVVVLCQELLKTQKAHFAEYHQLLLKIKTNGEDEDSAYFKRLEVLSLNLDSKWIDLRGVLCGLLESQEKASTEYDKKTESWEILRESLNKKIDGLSIQLEKQQALVGSISQEKETLTAQLENQRELNNRLVGATNSERELYEAK
ncbi:hypothetical protein AA313_de0209662 [Arthrobotrys entomopaga]|nr:hypothetical protein AA313_de0209662 [Arthrobotrys entomopaga]